jgi:hypothetical protein
VDHTSAVYCGAVVRDLFQLTNFHCTGRYSPRCGQFLVLLLHLWGDGQQLSGELPLTHLPFYSLLSSISIHYSLFSFATYLLVVLVLTVTVMVTVT